MEYTWCHVMFRCRLALRIAAGRVIMFIPVDSVYMYIAPFFFIYENKLFDFSDVDTVTLSVYTESAQVVQVEISTFIPNS